MKNINKYIILLFASFFALNVFGQDAVQLKNYSGIVMNKYGEKVNGAAIFGSFSRDKTLSNSEGYFEISVEEKDYLYVYHDNFQYYFKMIESDSSVSDTIYLDAIGELIEEKEHSVSFGYLSFDRITGSVERITGEELSDFPSLYLQEVLAGRLSGVRSFYGGGSPIEESFGMSIRGEGGITYVDGVIANITETTDEIEDIVIAKDFGSGFLYGGRAANGAILVNTKKGNPGEKLVQFTANTGIRNPAFVADMMDAAEYATNYNKALISDGLEPIYSQEAIDAYANGTEPMKYPNNKYIELMDSPSRYSYISGNFAGGNETANYFSHVGFYNSDGIESVGRGSHLRRLRLKNNVEVRFSKYGKMDIGIGGSFKLSNGPLNNGRDIFNTIYNYPSNALVYQLSDTSYGTSAEFPVNPYVSLAKSSIYETTQRDAYSRIGLEFDLGNITKGLTASGLYNTYIFNNLVQTQNPSVDMVEQYLLKTPEGNDSIVYRNYSKGEDDSEWARFSDNVIRSQYINAALNYNRDFNENHSVVANLSYTNSRLSGSQLPQEDWMKNIGGMINYMGYGKYVVEFNLMNSAVRQMSDSERARLTYAGGIAWLAHKESFLSSVSWLNMLKLRANYGIQTLPINYFYLRDDLYRGSGAGQFGVTGSTSSSSGFVRSFTASPNIVLPKKAYLNIGVDFKILNGSINGQLNYFKANISDHVIVPTGLYAILSSNRAYLPLINYGDEDKSGLDGRISYSTGIGQVRFLIDANLMYYTSYVSKSNNVDYPEKERNINSNRGGRILGLDSEGLFQSQDEINASIPQTFGEVKPGDIKYSDYNNDGVINEKDYHEIGHAPRIFYGLNLAVAYKNFTLSIHGDGNAGGSYLDLTTQLKGTNNYTTEMSNAWPVSDNLPRNSTLFNINNVQSSSFWLKKASYFNLRNVNLKYSLPQALLQKTVVKRANVYVSAKNLYVFSKNKDIYMPSLAKGLYEHPILRTYELGVEVTF